MTVKCAVYARVSTNTEDQYNSLKAQRQYFVDYIDKHPDYELYEIFADRGITGTKLDRPEFVRMLHLAGIDIRRIGKKIYFEASDREPEFNLILVKDTSRIARNIMIADVIRELRSKNVHFYFLDLGIISEKNTDFMVNLFSNFAEQYSRDISNKARVGISVSANNGKLHGVHSLYGYDYHDKELTINESEAEVVRLIFDMYSQNLGIRKIYNHLKDNGYRTRKGGEFSNRTIGLILANEKYCGINNRGKYTSADIFNRKKIKLPKDDWIAHDNIPAIISKELFDKCQQIRDSKVSSVTQRGVNYGRNEFSSLIKCSICGSSYTRNKQYNRVYWNCANKKTNGTKSCNSRNVYEQDLSTGIELFFESGIAKVVNEGKKKYVNKLESLKCEMRNRINNQNLQLVKDKQFEIESLEQQKDNLVDLFATGVYSRDKLIEKISVIDNKIDQLRYEIENESKDNDQILNDIKEVDELIIKIIKFKPDKPELIRDVIDKIIVKHDVELIDNDGDTLKGDVLEFHIFITSQLNNMMKKYYPDIEDDSIIFIHDLPSFMGNSKKLNRGEKTYYRKNSFMGYTGKS